MKYYHYIIFAVIQLVWVNASAQTEEKISLNEGVASYQQGDYKTAQERFERAYASNPKYARALYNAGNAAYLNGDFDKSKSFYNEYAKQATSKNEIAKAYFNAGNADLQKADQTAQNPEKSSDAQGLYKDAIKSYKESLKFNPNDPETKYNLTYALAKLHQQQQQDNKDQNKDQQENQENKDNKDGDKGDQNKDGDKQNDKQDDKQNGEDKKDENKEGDKKKDGNNGDGEKEEQPAKPVDGKISKEQAKKDLDAINADEGKILQKVYRKKGDEKTPVKSEKDW